MNYTAINHFNDEQHDPISEPPYDFSGRSEEEIVEQILDWFFFNFEDPVHSTPYDGREGGYLFIWGGPFEAKEVLRAAFGENVDPSVIETAVSEIEAEGAHWVPASRRRRAPVEDSPQSRESLIEAHKEMIQRIEVLEISIAQLQQRIGIGHNNPPEPVDSIGISREDIDSVKSAIDIIKKEPIKSTDNGASAQRASKALESFAIKIMKAYIWDKVRNIFIPVIEKLEFETIIVELTGAIEAVTNWLSLLFP